MVAGPSISNAPINAGAGPSLSGGGVGAALDGVSLRIVVVSGVAGLLAAGGGVFSSSVPEHDTRLIAVAKLRVARREVRRCLCIVDVLPVADSDYFNRYYLVVDVRQNAVRTNPIAPITCTVCSQSFSESSGVFAVLEILLDPCHDDSRIESVKLL